MKSKIQESGKLRMFLGVYYKFGHDKKGPYSKTTMKKDVNIIVMGYDKFTGKDIKVQKTTAAPGSTLSNIKL